MFEALVGGPGGHLSETMGVRLFVGQSPLGAPRRRDACATIEQHPHVRVGREASRQQLIDLRSVPGDDHQFHGNDPARSTRSS
jgi:hypothetical protein